MKSKILSIVDTATGLTEVEKNILHMFLGEEKTLDEIAEILQIRRERVRQLKQKALRRLKLLET
jgi:RNA polymerase sigma factor (sigma-70 family)